MFDDPQNYPHNNGGGTVVDDLTEKRADLIREDEQQVDTFDDKVHEEKTTLEAENNIGDILDNEDEDDLDDDEDDDEEDE